MTHHGVEPGSGSGRHSPRKNAAVIPGRMVAGQKGPPHVLREAMNTCLPPAGAQEWREKLLQE